MPILSKGTNFAATTQVTSDKLDNLVDAASFTNSSGVAVSASGTTGTCATGGGLEVTSGGQLQLQDGQIDYVKLSTDSGLNSGLYGIMNKVYPVGSIYIATVSTNPDTLLFGGGGNTTWNEYAEGRVIVGKESSGTFSGAGDTGGSETHTLTEAQLPEHYHFVVNNGVTTETGNIDTSNAVCESATQSGSTNQSYTLRPEGTYADVGRSSRVGNDTAHNNLQPYIVAYIWRRTA